MMMRREFVKMLAALCAGASAMPQQLSAFESYFNLNTPPGNGPFVAMDELFISGLATRSLPLHVDVYVDDATEPRLPMAYNAFGGIIRWAAMPDQKIIAKKIRWKIHAPNEGIHGLCEEPQSVLTGYVSCIHQDGIRRNTPISAWEGNVGA